MNRTISMIIAVVLIMMSIIQFAGAESEAPATIRLDEDMQELLAEKLGADQPYELVEAKGSYDVYSDFLLDYKPDLFYVRTYDCPSIQELWQMGLLEPFEPTEGMMEEIASFSGVVQRAIRENLTTPDGKLLGYPIASYHICSRPTFIGYWVPDAWTASPFKDVNPPTCFEEMLDFYKIYLDTPHDGFRLYYGFGTKWSFIRGLFVEPLLNSWIVQCEYAGKPVIFNTPEFIALVERSQKLIPKLVKSDYRAKVNSKMRYLFAHNQMLGYSYNTKDTFIFANMIPLRVTADQPPLLNMQMYLNCVSAGSAWASRAPELFTVTPDERYDVTDGVTYYDELAFPERIDVKAWNKNTKLKYNEYTQAWVDSIQELDQLVVPCILPELWAPDSQYSELMSALKKTFIKRIMKPEEFAAEMDRINAAQLRGEWEKDIMIVDMED